MQENSAEEGYIDPEFEFEAPQYCDFTCVDSNGELLLSNDAKFDSWFDHAHKAHEPRPAQPTLPLSPALQKVKKRQSSAGTRSTLRKSARLSAISSQITNTLPQNMTSSTAHQKLLPLLSTSAGITLERGNKKDSCEQSNTNTIGFEERANRISGDGTTSTRNSDEKIANKGNYLKNASPNEFQASPPSQGPLLPSPSRKSSHTSPTSPTHGLPINGISTALYGILTSSPSTSPLRRPLRLGAPSRLPKLDRDDLIAPSDVDNITTHNPSTTASAIPSSSSHTTSSDSGNRDVITEPMSPMTKKRNMRRASSFVTINNNTLQSIMDTYKSSLNVAKNTGTFNTNLSTTATHNSEKTNPASETTVIRKTEVVSSGNLPTVVASDASEEAQRRKLLLSKRKSAFFTSTLSASAIAMLQATTGTNAPSKDASRPANSTISKPATSGVNSTRPRKSIASSTVLPNMATANSAVSTKQAIPPKLTQSRTLGSKPTSGSRPTIATETSSNMPRMSRSATRLANDENSDNLSSTERAPSSDAKLTGQSDSCKRKMPDPAQTISKPGIPTKAKPLHHTTVAFCPAPTKKQKTTTKSEQELMDAIDDDLAEMLAKHNKKFRTVSYEPRKFSVKEIKQWEQEHGKKWYSLSAVEREEANQQLSERKKQTCS